METTSYSLRQFLKSVCQDLQWDFSVFWKLKHQSRMLLTWEDGYCNDRTPRTSVEGMSRNSHSGAKIGEASFDYEIDVPHGTSAGYPVELAVASMSCDLYSLGEGHVGRVAYSGKPCWIYADEFDSKTLPESADELHLQFAVGIQTILLVPVIPHGVVHLGSLRKVNEDPALVAYIRGMFDMFQHNLGGYTPSSINADLQGPLSSVKSSSIQILNPVQSNMGENDSMAFDNTQVALQELWECSPDMMFQFIDQDNSQVHGNNSDHRCDADPYYLPLQSSALSFLQGQLLNQLSDDNYQQGDVQFFSQCGPSQLGVPSYANFSANVYPMEDVMDGQNSNENGDTIDQINSHGFLNFSTDCELHKALGPDRQKTSTWSSSSRVDVCSNSLIYPTGFPGDIEPLVGESHGFSVKGGNTDNLFDVMASSMYDASGQDTASCQTRSRSSCSVPGENDTGPLDSLTDFVSPHGNVLTSSPSKSSLESSRSSLVVEKKHNEEIRCLQSRKSTKSSHAGQKRPRECDVQKPRPRDRQLIQDRVKELRELVPNGAKCSIDTLLDQTVKHMLFLRSATNRAEKLKQCATPEAVDGKNCKPSGNRDPRKGASWAYEVGSQLEVCPIIVKDLEQPGHMLIEMLCEENGLFLEFAQAIRGLELTILKGVMENRLNKSWACFIVEVSSEFRRMDIFWPLMKLLQRNSSISTLI